MESLSLSVSQSPSLKSEMNIIPLTPPLHIHLVGIGGAGISAIAQVLLGRGFAVSGSDRAWNGLMTDLQA
jgi:UDP-N-acetylmuramate--alanine ligase